MKRLITIISLCLFPLWTFGQNLEFFKILSRDSILFYLNELLEIPLLQYINSLVDFETLKQDNKPVACGIFIPVLFQNGKIIIPDYSFNSSNKVNFMNVIP